MSNIAVAQNVVFVPTLATFNSSPVSGYVPGGVQIAYLGGQTSELDGGQGFYQARDNDYTTSTSFPSVIADSTGLRWSLTSVVTQAQIVSALTAAGTLPGLDPLTTQGANIASATTTDLSAATGNYVNITGTTTITGLGTIAAGKLRFVTFTGILTLTHNATSLILPGAANITTAAGDAAIFVSLGSGNWKCIVYTEAAGGTPGTLGVPQGGTGQVSFTLGNILTGNGTSALGSFAPGAGVVTFLTTPSSANLAAAVTDETGSGALVFANTPTLVTPVLGVATGTTLALAQGTITDPATALAVTSTWNDAADTFDALDINVTNTNSAAASRLINLRVGGTSQFAVTRAGIGTFVGQVVAPSFAPNTTSGIIGTTTNDSAAAGSVGEFISQTVASGSAVPLTTATAANIASISLTAGDWDVWGNIVFSPNAATTIAQLFAAINTTSATLPTSPNGGAFQSLELTFSTGGRNDLSAGMTRISVASTTTVYLIGRASFAVNTMSAYGFIGARRVR